MEEQESTLFHSKSCQQNSKTLMEVLKHLLFTQDMLRAAMNCTNSTGISGVTCFSLICIIPSPPTLCCTLANLIPSINFILSVSFRQIYILSEDARCTSSEVNKALSEMSAALLLLKTTREPQVPKVWGYFLH